MKRTARHEEFTKRAGTDFSHPTLAEARSCGKALHKRAAIVRFELPPDRGVNSLTERDKAAIQRDKPVIGTLTQRELDAARRQASRYLAPRS